MLPGLIHVPCDVGVRMGRGGEGKEKSAFMGEHRRTKEQRKEGRLGGRMLADYLHADLPPKLSREEQEARLKELNQ